MQQGLVIKNTGSWYIVRTSDGTERNCKIKGNLRLKGFRCTNPVAVGDNVEIEVKEDGTAFIRSILPRNNYIIRRASNLSREFQILAANIDMAVLVVTLVNPETSTVFIDRFLATAEAYRVPVTIVFNKIDLLTEPEDRELLDAIIYLYRSIGYSVVPMSVVTGDGLDLLCEKLRGKTVLFSGNSGVGKSSIINLLVPNAKLKVGDISEVHHTGMHTTTFSEMLDIPGDNAGHIIDTPGVKGFGTIDFVKSEVAHYFPEIFKVSKECKYNNCTHTHEPGCAVRQAVENSLISQSRYNSYLSIIDDDAPDKYRKPF
ncbi:MAG: ribosome small subunit-dependent GTPase A [Muribaculaceae bacterium]|nr:ribosome small subunit-dependent GTPase A [Muribaculaceae bacterium]